MALRKKENFTICSAIPSFIPRQLALDVLHNHSEVITLNPLVKSHKQIQPPTNAASDEFYCTWYEITERIQYVPGLGKMGSGEINFNGCFHDMPWGLQTHIYAPMGVDMRAQYRIAGEQAGVPHSGPRELGLEAIGAPLEGLYLRADIEATSNIMFASFVKSQSKTAIKEMVERMVKKAESLDADVLKSMIDSEKLGAGESNGYEYEAPKAYQAGGQNQAQRPVSSTNREQPNYTSQEQQLYSSSNSNLNSRQSQENAPNYRYVQQTAVAAANELPAEEQPTHIGKYHDIKNNRSIPRIAELPDATNAGPRRNSNTGKAFIAELPGSDVSPVNSPYSPYPYPYLQQSPRMSHGYQRESSPHRQSGTYIQQADNHNLSSQPAQYQSYKR